MMLRTMGIGSLTLVAVSIVVTSCDRNPEWDVDGDGISDRTENNNPWSFEVGRSDSDPSRAHGTFHAGRLDGGINLPDRGTGYRHFRGTDATDTDDWATHTLLSCIEAVGRRWDAEGAATLVNVTDLSPRFGGRFSPHRSHQNGLDVDIRYVRSDGVDGPVDVELTPNHVDVETSRRLIEHFVGLCEVEAIWADLESLDFEPRDTRVLHDAHHSNHFHVRLANAGGDEHHVRQSAKILLEASMLPVLAASNGVAVRTQVAAGSAKAAPRAVATPRVADAATPPLRGVLVARDPSDRRQVLLGALTGDAVRSLHRTRLHAVRNVALAGSERYVAVLEGSQGRIEDGDYVELPFNRLTLLDSTGVKHCEAQLKKDDVYRYAFSPDGQRIAYLTGQYFEGGDGFDPDGGFVLDIGCCSRASGARRCKTRIAADATELSWIAGEPDSVFLRSLHRPSVVEKLDIATGQLHQTALLSTALSPDGAYQLLEPAEAVDAGRCNPNAKDRCRRVLRSRDNSEVELPAALKQSLRSGWVADRGRLLAGHERMRGGASVFDVRKGTLVQKVDRPPMPSRSSRGWVASPRLLVAPREALPMRIDARMRPISPQQLETRELPLLEPRPAPGAR